MPQQKKQAAAAAVPAEPVEGPMGGELVPVLPIEAAGVAPKKAKGKAKGGRGKKKEKARNEYFARLPVQRIIKSYLRKAANARGHKKPEEMKMGYLAVNQIIELLEAYMLSLLQGSKRIADQLKHVTLKPAHIDLTKKMMASCKELDYSM